MISYLSPLALNICALGVVSISEPSNSEDFPYSFRSSIVWVMSLSLCPLSVDFCVWCSLHFFYLKKSILGHKNCPQGVPPSPCVWCLKTDISHTFAYLSCLASEKITSLIHKLFPWGHLCSAKLGFRLWDHNFITASHIWDQLLC